MAQKCSSLSDWERHLVNINLETENFYAYFSEKELDDYVYDIYYAPRDIALEPEDLVFEGHEVFTSHIEDTRPDWEEDDDSNDEDNWRNEYPDTE